jgi:SAM-dependent methyltransferase
MHQLAILKRAARTALGYADESHALDPRWVAVNQRLAASANVIDLGCGNHPIAKARTTVDLHVDPRERLVGTGTAIDVEAMRARGVNFVNARVDGPLPFKNKEFDFAYSHHVFEHLEYPEIACEEMMRIANAGVIVTPSWFAEYMFGRPYHRWLLMQRSDALFFFRKRPEDDRPFGNHPEMIDGQWRAVDGTNPFEMLLNEGDWYKGREKMPRLSRLIRKHWFTRSPIMEVVFLWEDRFDYRVIQ